MFLARRAPDHIAERISSTGRPQRAPSRKLTLRSTLTEWMCTHASPPPGSKVTLAHANECSDKVPEIVDRSAHARDTEPVHCDL